MDTAAGILFMLCCLFLPSILGSLSERGEVKIIEVKVDKKSKPKPKPSPKPEVAEVKKENPLFNDCMNCLISLGLKKSEANEKTKKMFENKEYNSIEDFLIDAYKI